MITAGGKEVVFGKIARGQSVAFKRTMRRENARYAALRERNLFIRQLPYIVSGKSRSPLFPSYQLAFASLLLFIQRKAYSSNPHLAISTIASQKEERQAGVMGLTTGQACSSNSQLSLAFRRIEDDTKSDKYNWINYEIFKSALNLRAPGPIQLCSHNSARY